MNLISVITNLDNIVSEIYTYKTVREAEKKFIELVKLENTILSDESVEWCLDDGFYESVDSTFAVCITHHSV